MGVEPVRSRAFVRMAGNGATPLLPGAPAKVSSPPRLCENDFADHRGASLIHAVHHARIKDSPRPLLRFYYCALTATLSVFTQPGPEGAIRGRCHGRLQRTRARRLRGRRSVRSHDRKIMVWKTQALCATVRLE